MRAYIDRKPYRFPDEPPVEGEWMVCRILEIRETAGVAGPRQVVPRRIMRTN